MCGGGGGCGLLKIVAPFLGPIGQIFSIASTAMSLFGEKPKAPKIPEPAAPPPQNRATGGATVQVGTDAASADNRVSGNRPPSAVGRAGQGNDVLAGLGRGGLAL